MELAAYRFKKLFSFRFKQVLHAIFVRESKDNLDSPSNKTNQDKLLLIIVCWELFYSKSLNWALYLPNL